MATPKIKVSQLTAAITPTQTDTFMILQGGVNKKISLSTLLNGLTSSNNIRINPSQYAINTSISSKNDANSIFVKGSTDNVGIGTSSPSQKLHVNGNIQVGSSSSDGVILQSSELITYTSDEVAEKTVSTLRQCTAISCGAGATGIFNLDNGSNGQYKTITLTEISSGKTAIITTNGIGFNTITMNSIGDTVLLQFFSVVNKWALVSNNGCVISTL